MGVEDPEIYAGGETEATPDLFVDLTHLPKLTNMNDYLKVLKLCAERCLHLRAKTSVCAATIALHQICALIQQTFMETLPFPPSRGELPKTSTSLWYRTTEMGLSEQRECLKSLSQLMRHYVTASRSLDGDRYDDSIRTFTTSTIFIHFDAIARVLVVPDNTANDINGGRSPLSLCLASGTSPSGDGALMAALNKSSPNISIGETKNNALNQLYNESNPKGSITYPMDTLGGISLKDLSKTMLIGDPRVATLRNKVLKYNSSLPTSGKIIFCTDSQQEKLQQKFGGFRGGTNLQWAFQRDKDDNGK
jgi:hypothetical protein